VHNIFWEVLLLFKLQICNAYTQEIIREKVYKKPDLIEWFINSATEGKEHVLFDEQLRTLKGFYVSHEVKDEGSMKVYKVFFNYRLSEIQARIAKLV
jgi:hypothetical protein